MSLTAIDFKSKMVENSELATERKAALRPWENICTKITAKSVTEIARQTGLDWTVSKVPATYQVKGQTYKANNQFILVKSDDSLDLGMASEKYHAVQPAEILKTYKALADKFDFKFDSAGSLDDGKRIFAVLDTGDLIDVKNDSYQVCLLAATSYDRSLSTKLSAFLVRKSTGATIAVPNSDLPISHKTNFCPSEITKGLEKVQGAVLRFKKIIEKLSTGKVTKEDAVDFLMKAMDADEGDVSKRKQNQIEKIFTLFTGESLGCSLATNGSPLHLLMSLCEFVDFHTGCYTDENRLKSSFFSTGLATKLSACKLISVK